MVKKKLNRDFGLAREIIHNHENACFLKHILLMEIFKSPIKLIDIIIAPIKCVAVNVIDTY